MGDPLAETSDLEDMWRPLADSEVSRASNLIDKASAMLRQATRQTIDTRIGLWETNPTDPRAVDPLVAATVVATIVKRFISNVDGVVSKNVTVGPYSQSEAFALRGDKNDLRGQMIVTDEDLATLAPELPPQVGSFMVGQSPILKAGMRATRHRAGSPVLIEEFTSSWFPI